MEWTIKNILILIFFIIICNLAGFIGIIFNIVKCNYWYKNLKKPSFYPPDWLFVLMWLFLYTLMGISLFILFINGLTQLTNLSAIFYLVILFLINSTWSILFFARNSLIGGIISISILWITTTITVYHFYLVSKLAGLMLIPYFFWVSFIGFINFRLWQLNKPNSKEGKTFKLVKSKYSLNNEEMTEVISKIDIESKPDLYFYIMTVSSCIMSTYGLLSANLPVIIGSMVIAPLMYPILQTALNIIKRNRSKIIIAFKAEAVAVIFSIILSAILAIFWSKSIINHEITSRTLITLSSVIIAFASGIAGATAVCYRPYSHVIAAVAIAISLIPPICVVGIELSRLEYNLAFGAMLLFLTNILAINFAAIIIFKLAGFTSKD